MLSDFKFALRQLTKHRGLTVVAVLTLALGIGANTAIFSAVHSVLIDVLPYPEPERLMGVHETVPDGGINSVSGGAYKDWRAHSTSFEYLAIYEETLFNLTGEGTPERISALEVSADFLRALGVAPALGRGFLPGEDAAGGDPKIVVLTHELWQQRFGGDPEILGRGLTLDQARYEIVGVLPPGALFRDEAEILVPSVIDDDPDSWERSGHWRQVVGRLDPGVTAEGAQRELRAIKERLNSDYPAFKSDWSVAVLPLQETFVGDTGPTLAVLMGTVALVLLIACANVSNLLLARGQARSREMAIRSALGAHSWRIVRQLLIESLVLAALGCGAGLLVAAFGVDLLASGLSARVPGLLRPELDLEVFGFSILVAGGCGLLFGLLPALRAARRQVGEGLKDAARGSTSSGETRAQGFLVASEFALTTVLLVGAGLFLRSFVAVVDTDPGFNPRGTLAFDLSFPSLKYPEAGDRLRFIRQLTDRVAALPGVETVGSSSTLPLSNQGWTEFASRADREPRSDYTVKVSFVGGDYVPAMGLRLLSGRTLTAADAADENAHTLVVDATIARDLYPGEEPLGQRLRFMGHEWEIVGVVAPVRHFALDRDPLPGVYASQVHFPWATSVVVRSSLPPAALADAVRETVLAADPDQPIANIRTLEQAVSLSLAPRRTTLRLLGFFAGVAILLAAIGIYGVMSYSIGRRSRELSIRRVLGARREDVVRLVLSGGLRTSLAGIGVGLAAAWMLAGLVESLLFGIDARDPWVFVGAIALLLLASVAAIGRPALVAARANPAAALRAD
ncbi:MAG: ABC transporter permease [Acidobacteriota bacterium]